MIVFDGEQQVDEFVDILKSYINTPFRHRGRDKEGFDCAGIVISAFNEMGFTTEDLRIYGREPHRDGLKEVTEKNLGEEMPFTRHSLMKGDILLMKFKEEPQHVAVVSDHMHGGLSIIHCYGSVGYVVEHRLDDVWFERIKHAYRVKRVVYITEEEYLKNQLELEEQEKNGYNSEKE